MPPLVSIICLCYNHQSFLEEALDSVLNQTYPNIEIIVVDDASSDGSKVLLKRISEQHKLTFLDLKVNVGNCAAFNKAFAISRGQYIIDFSTDDVLMLDRVEKQVEFFETLAKDCGVIFSDAEFIDSSGLSLGTHYRSDKIGVGSFGIPQGDVYADLVARYFIAPPTMMIRRKVLEDLNGYDESLAYEDFDFWIRSSRIYKYGYQDAILTKVRKSENSKSRSLYRKEDKQLLSTYKVCLKAASLNRSEIERKALVKRLRYESKHAVLTGNFEEATLFFFLLKEQHGMDFISSVFSLINSFQVSFRPFRNVYLRIKYGKNW